MAAMDEELTVTQGGVERIDDLEPLWAALQRHHAELQPEIGGAGALPVERSWARRRGAYLDWLAEPEGFLLIAEREGQPIGYTVTRVAIGWSVWDTGERLGVVETLAVLPEERGRGVGARLLDAAERRLVDLGVRFLEVSVIAANDDAIRFYEHRGLERAAILFAGRMQAPPER
jgi:ribosomal protein S18 acetylase RimI-like enzyme